MTYCSLRSPNNPECGHSECRVAATQNAEIGECAGVSESDRACQMAVFRFVFVRGSFECLRRPVAVSFCPSKETLFEVLEREFECPRGMIGVRKRAECRQKTIRASPLPTFGLPSANYGLSMWVIITNYGLPMKINVWVSDVCIINPM